MDFWWTYRFYGKMAKFWAMPISYLWFLIQMPQVLEKNKIAYVHADMLDRALSVAVY